MASKIAEKRTIQKSIRLKESVYFELLRYGKKKELYSFSTIVESLIKEWRSTNG